MAELSFKACSDLQNISHWGCLKLLSEFETFCDCKQMTVTSRDNLDLSNTTNLSCMFKNCYRFNGDVSNWDTSKATDMSQMFSGCVFFTKSLSKWNISSVTTMKNMFFACKRFNPDFTIWTNTDEILKNVKTGGGMPDKIRIFIKDLEKTRNHLHENGIHNFRIELLDCWYY